MPAPRRSAERAGQRSTPPAAVASAPNQTRRTARPRHPGQGAGAPNAGPVHLTETDAVIPAHNNAAVGPGLPAPRDAADLPVEVEVVLPDEVVRPGSSREIALPDTTAVELAGLMHELSERLLSADDVSQGLERLAIFTAGAVPTAVRCSVVLITEGEGPTLTASGSDGRAVDECQLETGEGPGLDAARTRTMVIAQNLLTDPRWPDLADCALAEDVHAAAAIPLDVQRSSVGALTIYVRMPQGIGPDLLLTAMAIVNQAEILLSELSRRAALGEGATVDRAVGVIIAQRGCGVREAYDVLQETAQRLGMDRQSVAERLIAAAARTRDNR